MAYYPPKNECSSCFCTVTLDFDERYRSLPDLFEFICSALQAWVILLKSSSSLKSFLLTLFRRGSRPNFEWVPSRIQKFRIAAKRRTEIFVLLGGSGGMLPWKILKIKLLRLLEIAFPTNILKITFFPSSHKLLFQLEIFSNKFHSLWRQKRHNCISGLLKSVNNV